jgi:hypothetical protein
MRVNLPAPHFSLSLFCVMFKPLQSSWLSQQRGSWLVICLVLSLALNLFLLGFLSSSQSQQSSPQQQVLRVEMQSPKAQTEVSAPVQRLANTERSAVVSAPSSLSSSSWASSWVDRIPALPSDPGTSLPPLTYELREELAKAYENIAKLPEHREVIDAVVAIQRRNKLAGRASQTIHVLDVGMNLGAVSFGILAACSSCRIWGFEPIS